MGPFTGVKTKQDLINKARENGWIYSGDRKFLTALYEKAMETKNELIEEPHIREKK